MQQPISFKLFVTVARDKIALLKFILEGYDGLASLSTVDSGNGLLVLRCYPDCRDEMIALLGNLPFDVFLDASLEKTLTNIDNCLV